jgi:hypothetical protein
MRHPAKQFYLFTRKKGIGAVGLLCLALCMVGGWVPPVAAAQTAEEKIFSYGAGPIEVLIFTDYYCHPCQGVEPYLEGALTRLLELGAKISFVDKPIHRVTPIYSKYFLYAARKAGTFQEALRIRRVLFGIARANVVASERELVQSIKNNHVEMTLFDVQPVFGRWVELIKQYDIKSTPTCVVSRPDQTPLIIKGSEEIPKHLDQLILEMSRKP